MRFLIGLSTIAVAPLSVFEILAIIGFCIVVLGAVATFLFWCAMANNGRLDERDEQRLGIRRS